MTRRIAILLATLGVAGALGGAAAAAPPAPTNVGDAGGYHEQAYPQTRPRAGQYCRRIDRGVVTRASNGRLVRCTPEGSRQRWRYVR